MAVHFRAGPPCPRLERSARTQNISLPSEGKHKVKERRACEGEVQSFEKPAVRTCGLRWLLQADME